jgi:hypothetical protein
MSNFIPDTSTGGRCTPPSSQAHQPEEGVHLPQPEEGVEVRKEVYTFLRPINRRRKLYTFIPYLPSTGGGSYTPSHTYPYVSYRLL